MGKLALNGTSYLGFTQVVLTVFSPSLVVSLFKFYRLVVSYEKIGISLDTLETTPEDFLLKGKTFLKVYIHV